MVWVGLYLGFQTAKPIEPDGNQVYAKFVRSAGRAKAVDASVPGYGAIVSDTRKYIESHKDAFVKFVDEVEASFDPEKRRPDHQYIGRIATLRYEPALPEPSSDDKGFFGGGSSAGFQFGGGRRRFTKPVIDKYWPNVENFQYAIAIALMDNFEPGEDYDRPPVVARLRFQAETEIEAIPEGLLPKSPLVLQRAKMLTALQNVENANARRYFRQSVATLVSREPMKGDPTQGPSPDGYFHTLKWIDGLEEKASTQAEKCMVANDGDVENVFRIDRSNPAIWMRSPSASIFKEYLLANAEDRKLFRRYFPSLSELVDTRAELGSRYVQKVDRLAEDTDVFEPYVPGYQLLVTEIRHYVHKNTDAFLNYVKRCQFGELAMGGNPDSAAGLQGPILVQYNYNSEDSLAGLAIALANIDLPVQDQIAQPVWRFIADYSDQRTDVLATARILYFIRNKEKLNQRELFDESPYHPEYGTFYLWRHVFGRGNINKYPRESYTLENTERLLELIEASERFAKKFDNQPFSDTIGYSNSFIIKPEPPIDPNYRHLPEFRPLRVFGPVSERFVRDGIKTVGDHIRELYRTGSLERKKVILKYFVR